MTEVVEVLPRCRQEGARGVRRAGHALLAVVVLLWAAGMLGFSGYLTYRSVVTAVHGRPSAIEGDGDSAGGD